MSHHDCQPYYLRTGDQWTKIDYSQPAKTWMHPLKPGQETGMVEIPANWYLDDLPPLMFIKKAPNSHGWVDVRSIEQLWKDHFDYFYREYDEFIFPLTIHPDVSGHPHVLLMHERLIEYINGHEGGKSSFHVSPRYVMWMRSGSFSSSKRGGACARRFELGDRRV